MSEPSAATASTSRPLPRALSVASRLCWLLAILPGIGVITLQGQVLAFVQRAGPMARLELFLAVFADAVAYGAAGYLLRKGGHVGGWIGVLAPGLLTLDRLRFLLSPDSGASRGLLTLNLVVILLNLVIIMLVVRGWRHFVSEDSAAPGGPSVSLSQALLVASIVCFACGILIGLFTISFVISGFQDANPLAMLAVVYLVPSLAYCIAGYLVLTRRRAGTWLAVLTAAAWSAPLLAYDGQPGWLWTGSASFFLVANFVIILLVALNWRHLRPFTRQVGG